MEGFKKKKKRKRDIRLLRGYLIKQKSVRFSPAFVTTDRLPGFASVVSDPVIKPPPPHTLWSGQYDLVTQPPPLSKRSFDSVS